MARPVLFDTDIGSDVDDALALGLILASPGELELVAVTTVAGDTALRARIAARLLGLAGRTEIEVCAGPGHPVLRPASRYVWFGHEPAMVVDGPEAKLSQVPAPEKIVGVAREVPGLEIVAVGPMTNLARALALDPDLPERVARVTIMGGHIRRVAIGSKVCEPGIDYNLCSDPEATVAVLGSGLPITLVSADVTLQTWLRRSDLAALESAGPLARVLAEQVRVWEPVQRRLFTGMGGTLDPDNVAFLHDPLTVQALIDPAPLGFERLRIVPTLENGVLRTREADPATGLGAEMMVATAVDAADATDAIARRLTRL